MCNVMQLDEVEVCTLLSAILVYISDTETEWTTVNMFKTICSSR